MIDIALKLFVILLALASACVGLRTRCDCCHGSKWFWDRDIAQFIYQALCRDCYIGLTIADPESVALWGAFFK